MKLINIDKGGKIGEVINSDFDKNLIITSEKHKDYLLKKQKEQQIKLQSFTIELNKLENDFDKTRIKIELSNVNQLLNKSLDSERGEFAFRTGLFKLKDTCENLGYRILALMITTQLGY